MLIMNAWLPVQLSLRSTCYPCLPRPRQPAGLTTRFEGRPYCAHSSMHMRTCSSNRHTAQHSWESLVLRLRPDSQT